MGWRGVRCVAGVDSRVVFGLVRSGSVRFGCWRCRGVSWFWWGGLGNAFVDHLLINCGFTGFGFPIWAPPEFFVRRRCLEILYINLL